MPRPIVVIDKFYIFDIISYNNLINAFESTAVDKLRRRNPEVNFRNNYDGSQP